MSGYRQFLDKGLELAGQATSKDEVVIANSEATVAQYEEVLRLYENACKQFMAAIKYNPNTKSNDAIRRKVDEYLKRSEEINGFIKKKKEAAANPKPKAAAEGAGSGAGGESDGELREALMNLIVMESPDIHWDDVAGLHGAKEALQEAVILPLRLPHLFTGKRQAWKGILLYGPPGTGKSYIAKAVATEANNSTFISATASGLISKWQGQSERLVKELFLMAREKKPAIIFLDECDSLCSSRGSGGGSESSTRVKTEFLTQMQGVGNDNDGILVLGATNLPWALDSAVRRRFEKRIYIPLPDEEALIVLFTIHLGKTPSTLTKHDILALASRAVGRSGADIGVLIHDAIMYPVRQVQSATHFRRVQLRITQEGPGPDGKVPSRTISMYDQAGKFESKWYEDKKAEREWKDAVYWTPCSPGDVHLGAEAKTWMTIEDASSILEPPINIAMMEQALHRSKATVGPDDLVELDKWTATFGQEGD